MPRSRRPGVPAEVGITLVDAVIGLSLLALVTALVITIFLFAHAQARVSGLNAEAATWAQGELEYLLWLGYSSPCLNLGTRTITRTTLPCTPLEPRPLVGFEKVMLQVEQIGPINGPSSSGLKRITVQMFRSADNLPFFQMVGYVTQFQ